MFPYKRWRRGGGRRGVAVRGNPLFTEVGNVNLMAQINDALNTNACRLSRAPAAVLKVGVASRQRVPGVGVASRAA